MIGGDRRMNKLIDNMFTDAFVEIARVCSNALTSGHHMPDDWKQLTIAEQFDHLIAHLGGLNTIDGQNIRPDASEDHLTNLCCRALMALQLRIEGEKNAQRNLPPKT